MAGRPFSELVKMGEAIEDGLKTYRIVSMTGKSAGSGFTGFMRKKKEDVASISHIPKPKRREDFPMGAYASPPPNNYVPTPYNTVPVYYAQPNFQSPPPNYQAPPNTFHSPPPNYQAPQPNYQTPPPIYRTLQNDQPNTYQNHPPPNAYNAPRPNFEKKPPRVFTPLMESRTDLFKRLSAAGMIQVLPPKAVDPKNRFY
ncbi:extensin-1-like [Lycium ferocissimum]|uniref:extensin-1-like n=1 Tax=Lycium ferocissimum TaxID=112874 RepID=UPI00281602A5|nr:extensin-1-like [Lycium ferocissimum]